MAQARLTTVVEYLPGTENRYLLFETGGDCPSFPPDSAEWFAWLARHSSFHFKGKSGHFTARQEKKQRGETYWYAYRKAHNLQHKRYLGTTEKLTLTHLEDTALMLRETALGSVGEDEVLNAYSKSPPPEGLTMGSLTVLWHEDLLTITTRTDRYHLNRHQAAELLGYLYDRRRVLLKKRE